MSILVGMAVGGFYMTVTRAVVIIVVGSVLFGVQYSVDQWLLLGLVFVLTLVALYGLGMLMASLFLFWGREAWHLANLFQEPVYFLGGMYAPVKVLGPLAALAIGLLPLAVGLDAIRQLTFTRRARHRGPATARRRRRSWRSWPSSSSSSPGSRSATSSSRRAPKGASWRAGSDRAGRRPAWPPPDDARCRGWPGRATPRGPRHGARS